MRRKKGFIRSWLFIGLIILVVFSLSGVGLAVAYKNGRFAQAQNPNPNTSPASDVTAAITGIGKTVSPTDLNPGDPFDITLDIPGLEDASGEAPPPADIMLLIDNSESMDRAGCSGSGCSGCRITYAGTGVSYNDNDRLCYAKTTTINLIKKAKLKNLDWQIGYQQFSNADITYQHRIDDFFRRLLTINNQNNVDSLINGLRGTKGVDQTRFGSAMGMGMDMAREELLKNGRPGVAKYVIIISDGAERPSGSNPSLSGFAQRFWPDGWPPTITGDPDNNWMNICGRLESRRNFDLQFIDPRTMMGAGCQTMVDSYCRNEDRPAGCILSCDDIIKGAGRNSAFLSCFHPRYKESPADMVKKNNIKVMTIGYYGGGTKTNATFLQQIAEYLYAPAEPGDFSPGYFAAPNPQYLDPIFDQIIRMISHQNTGAPFTMVETLPLNAHVNIGDVSISNGVNLGLTPILDHDAQGRQTITLDTSTLPNFGYSTQTDPDIQTFQVRIQNIQYSCSGNFDADQNWSADGVEFADNEKPSKVIWTFPASGRDPVTKFMPRGPISCSTQYSGDIYGTSISNYAFPGIDVSVAKGTNSNTTAVWSLSDYDFSASSFSSYNNFKNHVDKVTADLGKRAENYGPTTISNPNPHHGVNPQGGVWKASGDLTISGQYTIGQRSNQRATIIVNGDLNFDNQADISKPSSSSNNNLLFIVTGNVTIDASTVRLENVAIIAPYHGITVGNSAMSIKGLLAARNVILEGGATSGRQRIHYDTSFAIYPPPGLSSIDLPIFKEVKP